MLPYMDDGGGSTSPSCVGLDDKDEQEGGVLLLLLLLLLLIFDFISEEILLHNWLFCKKIKLWLFQKRLPNGFQKMYK